MKFYGQIQNDADLINKGYADKNYTSKTDNVGQKTTQGGEIFNDYDNNEALAEQASARGIKTAALGVAASAEGSAVRGTKTSSLVSSISVSISAISGNVITAKSTTLGNILDNIDENTGFIIRVGTDIYIPIKTCDISGILNNTITLTAYAETVDTSLVGQNITEVYVGMAYGDYSHSEGKNNMAIGIASHAEGVQNTAVGDYSHVEGLLNVTFGDYSHSEGIHNTVSGSNAHAEGSYNNSSNANTHTEGYSNTASGEHAHAEGGKTVASGDVSHAEGVGTKATGYAQHVQGKFNIENNNLAHIVGNGSSDTDRKNIHTLDWNGNAWFAGNINTNNSVSAANITSTSTISANNIETSSISDLNNTINNLQNKTKNIANGSGTESLVIGTNTASGNYSFAHGTNNVASGENSHAEGYKSQATGPKTHAEGYSTASANYAHSEGYGTIAAGSYQHVSGVWNIEDANPEGTDRSVYAEIVGNGGKDNPSNARTLDWSGNAWFAGDVKIGGTGQDDTTAKILATTDEVNKKANVSDVYTKDEIKSFIMRSIDLTEVTSVTNEFSEDAHLSILKNTLSGGNIECIIDITGYIELEAVNPNYSLSSSQHVFINGSDYNTGTTGPSDTLIFSGYVTQPIVVRFEFLAEDLIFNKFITTEDYRVEKLQDSVNNSNNITNGSGEKSLQQILDTESWNSTNEQVISYVTNSTPGANNGLTVNGILNDDGSVTIPVGAYGKLSTMMNGKSQTIGGKSHAEGSKTIALENNAHAEGNETFSAGAHSHAEGNTTTAIGNSAHAEGARTYAEADYSHAEGYLTKATGLAAHVEGISTEATGDYSHAEGNTCKATGIQAHAEGYQTEANGYAAHAQGGRNIASGAYSFAGGFENKAIADYQTVIGKANIEDTNNQFALIVGNGILDNSFVVANRSNAASIDWDGNLWTAGDVRVDGAISVINNITTAGTINTNHHADIDSIITDLLNRISQLETQLADVKSQLSI